jgi:hypothetical protein
MLTMSRTLRIKGSPKFPDGKVIQEVLITKTFRNPVPAGKNLLAEQALVFPFSLKTPSGVSSIDQACSVKAKFIHCLYMVEIVAITNGGTHPKL